MTKSASIWQREASSVLRQLMKKHSVTSDELALRLKLLGIPVSGQAVRNKLPRGTFSAAFFLAAIASMKASRVTLHGSELAKFKEKEAANSAAERLAEVEAAAQKKADAEKRKLQLETIRKAGIRSDLPAEVNRIISKMKKVKGKK